MMTSFQRNRNLQNILRLFNACAVSLFLFSRSSCFPILLQALQHSYRVFTPLFNHPFYMFLLLNAIILFIYALSITNGDVASTDEFLNINNPYPQHLTVTEQEHSSDADSQVFHKTVTAVTETCCTTVSTRSGDKASEKKCYRRVQSERRIVVTTRRDMKRFNTGLGKGRSCYVEQLSKDDFNRAVEDFIAKHKRMLWEEQKESNKTEYLTFTQ